jgi:predicted dehydrogenase
MTASAEPVDDKRFNLAVIGTGRWGSTMMRAINAHSGLSVVAVITSKSAVAGTETGDIPAFSSWQDAAGTVSIDGFVLAVPPDAQPAIAEQLIAAGFPVFLEKPLALTAQAAAGLLAAARKHGFIGVVDHIHLFAGEFQELCRRLPGDGAVRTIEAVSGNRGPVRDRWTPCWDWAPHDIAMSLAVMDEIPRTVTAKIIQDVEENGDRFRNYEIELDFGQRGRAHLVTGNAFDGHRREFRVGANDTSLVYAESAERARSLVVEHGDDRHPVPVTSTPPLTAALTAFAKRISLQAGGLDDLQRGADVVKICAAAHESVASGRSVAVAPR